MPMAKNNKQDISHNGIFAALAVCIKSIPGKCMALVTPTVKNPTSSDNNVAIPTIIIITPKNLANILKKNIKISLSVSKKLRDFVFKRLPCFSKSTPLTASEILSATFSKPSFILSPCFLKSTFFSFSETVSIPSLIFFSILLIFTASPVIVSFSAVVPASGTRAQKTRYIIVNVPPDINANNTQSRRTHIMSIPK